MDWIKKSSGSIRKIFVTHGEPDVSKVLAEKIKDDLNLSVVVPELGETFKL